jgi:sulfatase modifying factor 1
MNKAFWTLPFLVALMCLLGGCAVWERAFPPPSPTPTAAPPSAAPSGMLLVPGGPFYMGLTDEQADALVRLRCSRYLEKGLPSANFACIDLYEVLEAETPMHVVNVDAFYIDQFEVTNDQYRACFEAGECTSPMNSYFFTRSQYGDHPINAVSWLQASQYCAWAGKRLPTEAEWEKAARGPDGRLFPWGDDFEPSRANLCDEACIEQWADPNTFDGFEVTAPVGSFPEGVSPYGLYDMAGNVSEWVADWYARSYYVDSPTDNPSGPDHGSEMTVRGGAFLSGPGRSAATSRAYDYRVSPPRSRHSVGLRCAMDAPPAAIDPAPLLPPPTSDLLPPTPGDGVTQGWAVLVAHEHYDGQSGVDDQEAGFAYLDQLGDTLLQLGWNPDHIRTLRDPADPQTVADALRWLAQNADGDDLALLYYSAQSYHLDRHLRWHAFLPPLWADVVAQRVLLVDASDGEYFARAVSADGRGGLSIGSVRGDQHGWFGLADDGTDFTGPAFTHFFLAALRDPAADDDHDGRVSVQEAASYADAAQRAYIHQTIFPVDNFLRRFAAPWQPDPSRDPDYPAAWIGDWAGEPVFLNLEQ